MRPNNSIAKIRKNAWHLLSLHQQKLWNECYAGSDLLNFDELCCALYEALKLARKGMKKGKALEAVASAMHKFEEAYDVGADGKYEPPGQRPPEITEMVKELYGF